MTGSRTNGMAGEAAARTVLGYRGYVVTADQPMVYGHRLDLEAIAPDGGPAVVEVKVWATQSGTDTVKKAIADAYDIQQAAREAGDEPPRYLLVLSRGFDGLHRAMLRRAEQAGAIWRCLIL